MKLIVYFVIGFFTISGLMTCGTASPDVGSSHSSQAVIPSPTVSASPNVSSSNVPSNGAKPDDTWRVYTPPDKSFSVEVPCDMDQTNVSASETPIYEYSCATTDDSAFTGFIVEVLNISEKAKVRDAAAFEQSLRDEFLPDKRVTKMEPIQVSNGIGREIVVTNIRNPESTGRARVIVIGKRRYDAAIFSTDPKALESPLAERFLSSFKPLQ
jgi:hypothetical protein